MFAGSSGDELDMSKENRDSGLVPPGLQIIPLASPNYLDRLKVC